MPRTLADVAVAHAVAHLIAVPRAPAPSTRKPPGRGFTRSGEMLGAVLRSDGLPGGNLRSGELHGGAIRSGELHGGANRSDGLHLRSDRLQSGDLQGGELHGGSVRSDGRQPAPAKRCTDLDVTDFAAHLQRLDDGWPA